MASGAHPTVVIDPGCAVLRRRLGPVAWVALEELMLTGEQRGGVVVTEVSIRGLAAHLGLSKDTVHRAVSRLRTAGLVSCDNGVHDDQGRFTARAYRIELSSLPLRRTPALDLDTTASVVLSRRPSPSASNGRRRAVSAQLVLLELHQAD